MQINSIAILAMAALSTKLAWAERAAPIQSMFVPLPEESLYKDIFYKIKSNARAPITNLISVSISTDNTIIYYDHWEDGYDNDVTGKKQGSTEIWGDGDKSNGCAPIVIDGKRQPCTDKNDILMAGDVSILESTVALSGNRRDPGKRYFDGGDLLQATRPVAMTRAAYPATPGSLMAGAVEVIEQGNWGTSFVAPVGNDVGGNRAMDGTWVHTSAYKLTKVAVMAGEDNTVVRVNGSWKARLGKGKSLTFDVKQGDEITTTNPVQAHLITGDIGSTYELRWYYLAPTDQWYNEAYAPVGDSKGKVRVTVYNPNSSTIKCTMKTLKGSETYEVPPKKHVISGVIDDGYAAKFTATGKFYAFSSTDTANTGQLYDWGYPLMGVDQLTEQVIIGLGYGCTENDCDSDGERSIVWVTPVEDATIYIDYNNDGTVDKTTSARALQGVEFTDDGDEDMSGANIWATDKNGAGVKIAAAWGQKAKLSKSGDSDALDLGTVVVPFETQRTSCSVTLLQDNDNNKKISVGDIVEQRIEVINVGQLNLIGGSMAVETPAGPVVVDGELDGRGDSQVFTVSYQVPVGYDVLGNCDLTPYEAPPSDAPTKSPTPFPTPNPTPNPTPQPTPEIVLRKITPPPTTKAPKSSASGDPHFKTWTGEKFDYHGECDLVLVDNPEFNNGQGLRVHIRTTRVKYFSFIEKVAIKIGHEVLEFDNDIENFLINGEKVEANRQHHKTMISGLVVRRDAKALSIRIRDGDRDARQAGTVAKIDLHTRKNGFPAVIFDGGVTDVFKGSLGLLGEWGTGRKLARDGITEIEVDPEDAEAFALEWQVRDTEPMLFKESRFPQFPTTCTPAKKMPNTRLGYNKAREEAEEACAHWKHDADDCVFDVMATQDVLVASEGHIVHIE